MERSKEFFDNWFKSQMRIFENLTDIAREFQNVVLGQGADGGGGRPGLHNLYRSWATTVMNALGDKETSNMNFIRDTFAKTLNGSNVYAKLYELWLPFFNAIQEKTISPEAYKDLTDPVKFKEALDGIFGFEPGAMSQISAEATKVFETFAGSAKEFIKPWMEASEQNFKIFPQFVEGHPESSMKIFNNMFKAFDSTFGWTFRLPAVGKDREKLELFLRGFDDISLYFTKSMEYKQVMYLTGLAAMEKVIETVAENIKSGKEMTKFEDFFHLWLEVNEKTYHALFQTEDFSKMQGKLLEAELKVRKHFFKLMELYLYDFPIALRSEMDDLYKTVYDLKKKVKNLEKQVQATT